MNNDHVDTRHRIVLSLAISLLASVLATSLARKRSKPAFSRSTQDALNGEDETVSSTDEEQPRKVAIDNHNLIFVVMPFALCLDGRRVFSEMRASRSRLRALSLLRERFARGEVDAQHYESMRRDLEA
jgi:hypothetical protein